jgi:hypothetical protein
MMKWSLLLSFSLFILAMSVPTEAQTDSRPDLTHYLRANSLATTGKHPQAIREYITALALTSDPQIRSFCQSALKKYKLLSSSGEIPPVSQSQSSTPYLPDNRFAVARIISSDEKAAGYRSQFQIPQQYPQISGFDAERSYLYQHGIWQGYGGPINTYLPDHTHAPGGHAAQIAFRQHSDSHSWRDQYGSFPRYTLDLYDRQRACQTGH